MMTFIWLLIGFIGWFMTYHSARKEWYIEFNEEYWKSDYHSALIALCIVSPIYICSGPLMIILTLIFFKYPCLYFNIKRYEKKHLLKKYPWLNK